MEGILFQVLEYVGHAAYLSLAQLHSHIELGNTNSPVRQHIEACPAHRPAQSLLHTHLSLLVSSYSISFLLLELAT